MKNCIETTNLVKHYEHFELKNVNLTVPMGSIVGLVGENGAGKTTIIKLLLNLIQRDSGKVEIFGQNLDTHEMEIKEEVGIVLEDSFFAQILTPKEVEKVLSSLYKKWDHALYQKYLKQFQLPENQEIKQFSKGMKMKLQIASALAHHPKLLILDEPTSGLDPVVRTEILDIFQEFIQEEDHTILLSTHITSDLEHIADYITFIHNGSMILSENKDILLEEYGIIRCDEVTFKKLLPEEKKHLRKNRYNYEILTENKIEMKKKYPNIVIDKATIEEIMLLLIRGNDQ